MFDFCSYSEISCLLSCGWCPSGWGLQKGDFSGNQAFTAETWQGSETATAHQHNLSPCSFSSLLLDPSLPMQWGPWSPLKPSGSTGVWALRASTAPTSPNSSPGPPATPLSMAQEPLSAHPGAFSLELELHDNSSRGHNCVTDWHGGRVPALPCHCGSAWETWRAPARCWSSEEPAASTAFWHGRWILGDGPNA